MQTVTRPYLHIISTMTESKEILSYLETMRQWEAIGIAPANAKVLIDDIQNRIVLLAEELGLVREQYELQNLSVKLGYPEDYRQLKRLLQESEASCEMVFQTFALPIRAMLDDMGIEYEFKYRMKSVYSIWRKMKLDHKHFDDVYDLFATRIVYKPKPTIEPMPFAGESDVDREPTAAAVKEQTLKDMDAEIFYCWRIYTVISMLYRIHPDRIRNWITHPKPSGYQALQMTVMGPDCNWIEIQIRSERMDYNAEYGTAAHWKYKAGN